MQQQTPLLATMSVKLTRAEMREIIAGSDDAGFANCTIICKDPLKNDTGTTCQKENACKDHGGRAGGNDCFCN